MEEYATTDPPFGFAQGRLFGDDKQKSKSEAAARAATGAKARARQKLRRG
jgi:hypothetical protein